MKSKFHQNFFKCHHPEKYSGNPKNIIYRSSWEMRFMIWLDNHPEVETWASEELFVPYRDPTTNRLRRYFPDFLAKFKDGRTFMIEIKPKKQTKRPDSKNKKQQLKESFIFARNIAKWEAARKYCEQRQWEFKILTEDNIFGRKKI